MRRLNAKRLIWIATILAALVLGSAVVYSQAGYERSGRRAFYTAPPVIPHEVMDETNETCLMCHSDVVNLGSETTIKTPHPQFSNCTQCHVTAESHDGQSSPPVATDWVGLEEPTDGTRLHEQAPPVMPHRLFLREDCLSCHHPDHPNELMRTPHPERSNCRQCHVADKANEFVALEQP